MIPEFPTCESLKPVLDLMFSYYFIDDGRIVIRWSWLDNLSAEAVAALRREREERVMRENQAKFLVGYRGDSFLTPGRVFAPCIPEDAELVTWIANRRPRRPMQVTMPAPMPIKIALA
jgi:hypothetical protein